MKDEPDSHLPDGFIVMKRVVKEGSAIGVYIWAPVRTPSLSLYCCEVRGALIEGSVPFTRD